MQIRGLVADEGAVSPVVGTVILVAVVVILATAAGTFFLTGTQKPTEPPDAQFGYQYENQGIGCDIVTLSYRSGEPLNASNIYISVAGTTRHAPTLNITGTLQAGFAQRLETGVGRLPCYLNGSTLRIFWEHPSKGERQAIGEFDIPANQDRLRSPGPVALSRPAWASPTR